MNTRGVRSLSFPSWTQPVSCLWPGRGPRVTQLVVFLWPGRGPRVTQSVMQTTGRPRKAMVCRPRDA